MEVTCLTSLVKRERGGVLSPLQCLSRNHRWGLICLCRRKNNLSKNRNPLLGMYPRILFIWQVTLINSFYVMKLVLPLLIWEYSYDVECQSQREKQAECWQAGVTASRNRGRVENLWSYGWSRWGKTVKFSLLSTYIYFPSALTCRG